MGWAITAIYGLFAFVGLLNLLLMRRPPKPTEDPPENPKLIVLIPARNEESNLRYLVPALLGPNPGLDLLVYDDESEDATAEVAEGAGAKVIRAKGPLPDGWTGKNRACHELALAAARSDAEWFLFLDADVQPRPDFVPSIKAMCRDAERDGRIGLVTGFPTIIPGRGIEPMFLAWVGWVLIVTNPYGLVSRSGLGHNRFKNGQVHCWRREVYLRIMPNERVRSRIMEDVEIGRLLARERVPVEVANLSTILSVRMYENWRETLDGMSKNSFEITNNEVGAVAVALLLLFLGCAWALAGPLLPWALGLFVLSGLATVWIVRTAFWPVLLMPLIPTIGAFTIMRSMSWHRKGTVKWKGRVYGGSGRRTGSGRVNE